MLRTPMALSAPFARERKQLKTTRKSVGPGLQDVPGMGPQEHVSAEVRHWAGEKIRVKAVKDSTVTRDDGTRVFHSSIALHGGDHEVAEQAGSEDDRADPH